MALTPWPSHFKTDFELARRRRQEANRHLQPHELELDSRHDDEAWTGMRNPTGVLAPRVIRFGVSMNF